MTKGRTMALWLGAAAAGAHVLAGATTHAPLAGRLIFDGFAPPPPYQWVSPPPDLADQNVPAAGGSTRTPLAEEGSEPTVFSTVDLQVSLALIRGTIATRDGDDSVDLSITPLAPSGDEQIPSGLEIKGNVYRIEAIYRPSGTPAERFEQPAQLSMVYPSGPDLAASDHEVLHSSDGTTWVALETIDVPIQHQAGVDLPGPGLVVVAGAPEPSGPGRSRVLWFLLAGVLIAAGLVLAWLQWPRAGSKTRR
jgi:hypothetical protein